MLTRMRRRSWGQGLAEVAVVCSIMTSMAGGGAGAAWGVMDMAKRTRTISNLKQIYLAIQMAADDNDGLPNAEFYPNVAKDRNAVQNSPRSIVKLVGKGLPSSLWISPAAPTKFQEAGLTFVWNTQVNGKNLDQLDGRTWLLMDMNAAAYAIPDFVPRSTTGYLVLYSDGSVKYEHVPPTVVPEAQKGALAQQVSQLTGKPAAGGGGGQQAGGQGGGEGGQSDANVPADPDAEVQKKEEQARESNPDEDDAADD